MSVTSGSAQSLQARLEKIQANLQAQENKLRSSRRGTLVVGALALLLAGGYFFYGYQQFSSILQAKSLVAVAQDLVNTNLPTARKALAEQINQSADVWAQSLSKQALDAVPDASVKLEDYVIAQVNDALSQAVLIQDQQFRDFVRDKHAVLQQGFEDLAKGPELGEEAFESIGAALEENLHNDLDAQATELFGALVNLNAKLEHLRSGRNLTPDEMVERRVLMLANRIKLNEEKANADAPQSEDTDTASLPISP